MRAPLEPDVQAFVERIAAMQAAAGDAPAEPDLAQSRMGYGALLQLGAGTPPEVASVEDCAAPGPAGEIPVRVYRPSAETGLPVIVYFHGGGWTIGSIDTHDAVARQLAASTGAVVVNVEYRLAPENRFPAAIDDAFAATRWVHAHASELGVDASRLAVAGDSAGGNLAAVVALRARDEGGPPIVFQLLVYPVVDCAMDTKSYDENASGYLLGADTMKWFWNNYVPDEGDRTNPHASPLRARDLSNLPPALIITAGYDPLRDEGAAYAERLRAAGVVATLSNYEGAIHQFWGMPAMFGVADRALKEATAALQAAFAT